MRFSLNSDHKEFYSKNGFIEFDELLNAESLISVQAEIAAVLAARLKIPSSRLQEQPPKALFDAGFDLWRDSHLIKKLLFKPTLSEVAAQLFQESVLRIGFDQYIDTGSRSDRFLSGTASLGDFCCAKPLAGALIIKLEGDSDSAACPIPALPGNGIFLSPTKIVAWNETFSHPNLKVLIIGYGTKTSIYHLEKNDPHTHVWKGLGLVFGDRLNDHLHPIVYRG